MYYTLINSLQLTFVSFLESATMLNDRTIELNFVRNRLETFQATVLRDVQKRMSGMIDEVMQELRQYELQTNEFRNFATPKILNYNSTKSNTWSNRIRAIDDLQKPAKRMTQMRIKRGNNP